MWLIINHVIFIYKIKENMLIDTKNVLIQVDSDNISSIKQDTNETNIELMLLYVIGNFNLFKYNAFYYMEYP